MAEFTIEHLDAGRLGEAWPVARMAGAHFDSGWWQSEAEELIARGGGVLAARAPDGSIHGIAMYEPVQKPRVRRVLHVPRLITLELTRKAPCRSALSEALDFLATLLACNGIALPLPAAAHVQRRSGALYGSNRSRRSAE